MSKHVDDGLITGPAEKLTEVIMELRQFFLLKVTEILREGQIEKYLGRLITKIPTGFSLKADHHYEHGGGPWFGEDYRECCHARSQVRGPKGR